MQGSTMMRAVHISKKEGLKLKDGIPVPKPGPGEALIRIKMAGICNTDLEITNGYMGFQGIIGHEFVGVVESAPNGSGVTAGDRVVGDINVPCNCCENCHIGGVAGRNHCYKRTVLGILGKDGTFSEYITLPTANLHRVPDHIPDNVAVFAEPLAAAFRIVEQDLIKQSDAVAIIGDGKLGLMIAEALQTLGLKKLVHFGKHPEKLELGPRTEKETVTEDTAKLYENQFDVCIEASGSPSGLKMTSTITKPLGTIVLKTTCAADTAGFNTSFYVVKEQKLIGSRCGNFQMALDYLSANPTNFEKYISKIYNLEQAEEALDHAGRRGTVKIILQM